MCLHTPSPELPQRAAATSGKLQHPKYLGMRLASLIANWRCVPSSSTLRVFCTAAALIIAGQPPFARPFLDKHIGNSTIIWVQQPPPK
jgi:hypothetical protein